MKGSLGKGGFATHIGPESCGTAPSGGVEALLADRASRESGPRLPSVIPVPCTPWAQLPDARTRCGNTTACPDPLRGL